MARLLGRKDHAIIASGNGVGDLPPPTGLTSLAGRPGEWRSIRYTFVARRRPTRLGLQNLHGQSAMYRGVFLNLASNENRRAALTQHLAQVGAASRYERCEAIDGRAAAAEHPTNLDSGNLGLWLTHEKLVSSAGASPGGHLHIIEDDAVLANNIVELLEGILANADNRFPTWDLLFTDVFLPPQTDLFLLYLQKLRLYHQSRTYTMIDLARINFACTTSMVINKASFAKYAGLIGGNWKLGKPIDIYLRQMVQTGRLKAFLTVPFLTSISSDSANSDIRGSLDRSRRVCDTFRRALFPEADLSSLHREMQALTAGAKVSPLAALYLNAEMFMLSDQFVHF
jgi:hypothetical protein